MVEKKEGLFEVSWEVCNKVGGIYTVLTSKAQYVNNNSFDYTLIGPYFQNARNHDFLEEAVPEELKDSFNELKNEGIPCRFGRWMIKSEPAVILVDFSSLFVQRDEVRRKLWEDYQVNSLGAEFDFDEPVLFSIAAARVIDKLQRRKSGKTIAHFHEWMTGAGLLWLKKNNPKISTVFTTHATVLGRAIASSSPDFYSFIGKVDVEKEANARGIVAKHHIEKASAHNADVFTTVSEITGIEAGYLLSKKPQAILPNGIDLAEFSAFEELSIRHSHLKHVIKDFIISLFFPYYSFDLDETLLFFTIGRYEFANKGIDVFIDSLGKLNERMKKENTQKTIVSFFFVPAEFIVINTYVI